MIWLNKIKSNIVPILGISGTIMYGIYTQYHKYSIDKQLDNILNEVYYGKNHRWAIVTKSSTQKDRYRFSPYSGKIHTDSFYFDNNQINKSIDDYLYGKYYEYSSMETSEIKNFTDFSESITKHKFPHIRVIINENDCPETIKNRSITTYQFLSEAIDSHLVDSNPKYFIHSIDLRECHDINSQELENIINNSPNNVKVLLANQKQAGKDTIDKFKKNYDKIIFVGEYDVNIVTNMQNAFGTEYITHISKNINNVLDKLYEHNPKLFVHKISQGDTIDKITNEEKYGKVAFVSADTEFGYRLPEASGGNYMLNICDINLDNKEYIEITNKFIDTLVKNDVKSVVFTCCHSNTRGPFFASLFKEQCRSKTIDFNIYLMYPGVGRIHDSKYKNAKNVYCTKLT